MLYVSLQSLILLVERIITWFRSISNVLSVLWLHQLVVLDCDLSEQKSTLFHFKAAVQRLRYCSNVIDYSNWPSG